MSYDLSGTLKYPDGNPASDVEIELIARRNHSPLLRTLAYVMTTNYSGKYGVELEFGDYDVKLTYPNTFPKCIKHVGHFTVLGTTAKGLDLPDLLSIGEYAAEVPGYVTQIEGWLAEARNQAMAANASATSAAASNTQVASNVSKAETAANTATIKATESGSSAVAASESRIAAESAAITATARANEAGSAAATANSFATVSTTKATEASDSAAIATTKATESSTSATTAQAAATTATNKAAEATAAVASLDIESGAGALMRVGGARDTAITASIATKASSSITVNGKPLSENISLSAANVGAETAGAVTAHETKANTHQISGVDGLQSALDGKLPSNAISIHEAKPSAHLISGVSGLQAELDSKAPNTAVEDSALPFPDVWIPFSDSLKMIAGYGRDVKVGDDVVATYANFERTTTATYIDKSGVLRTAAVNEPRFEKEGLLIEGQSTNLITTSATLATSTVTVAAGSYTLSFYGTGSVTLSGAATGVLAGTAADKRVSLTVTTTAGALTLTVTGTCSNAQLEALPFATSYIPTNGAAATRAGDMCWTLWGGNLPLSVAESVTIASEFNLMAGTTPDSRTIVDIGTGSAALRVSADSSGGNVQLSLAGSAVSEARGGGTGAMVGRYDGAEISINLDGDIVSSPYTPDAPRPETRYLRFGVWSAGDTGFTVNQYGTYRCLWGHIRNFRIWHTALTDAQIKGIK